MIIGLIGNQCVGKDTIADYLVLLFGFKKLSFAEPIKQISKQIFNWDDNICNSNMKDKIDITTGIIPRDFFKWFGTDIMQYQFDNTFSSTNNIPSRSIWAYFVFKKIKSYLDDNNTTNIVISDFRFLHEYKLINDNLPVIYIIVTKENENVFNIYNNNKYWEYEINDIINILQNSNNTEIIYNNTIINTLYQNIDIILNKYNINKIDNNYIDLKNINSFF